MLTVGFLLSEVEFQTQCKFFCYSEKKVKRIEIPQEIAMDRAVKYMYVENDVICIEVEDEEVCI